MANNILQSLQYKYISFEEGARTHFAHPLNQITNKYYSLSMLAHILMRFLCLLCSSQCFSLFRLRSHCDWIKWNWNVSSIDSYAKYTMHTSYENRFFFLFFRENKNVKCVFCFPWVKKDERVDIYIINLLYERQWSNNG